MNQTNINPNDKMGPIIVVKKANVEFYRVVRMSDVAFRGKGIVFCRLQDMDYPFTCFDEDTNRVAFYRCVIDQMIAKGFAIAPYIQEQVPNTLHNNIVNFCRQNNLKVIAVELEEQQFPFNIY